MAKEQDQDTGLGLKDFLGGADAKETPQPEVEAVEKPASAASEALVPAQAPAQASSAEPAGLDKNAAQAVAKEAAAASPAQDWEHDENPYKKRYRDTHRDWNRLNQELLEQKRQNQEFVRRLDVLGKKFDGTYDPERDEPQAPSAEQAMSYGALTGKVEASMAAVLEAMPVESVMTKLERYKELFGNDAAVQQRILADPHPIKAALKAVDNADFFTKYGSDPDAILKKFRADFEANDLPKLVEAELKKRGGAGAGAKQEPEPKGIGALQGGSGAMDTKVARDNKGRFKPLNEVFGS